LNALFGLTHFQPTSIIVIDDVPYAWVARGKAGVILRRLADGPVTLVLEEAALRGLLSNGRLRLAGPGAGEEPR